MNTLYLIEWVNQVGNVFTDTLKLRGEERQFRSHTEETVWSRQINLWRIVSLKDSISLISEDEMVLRFRHLNLNSSIIRL